MGQDMQKILELESKFQELADTGHPNVIDNGFFLDAVFNVTAILKKANNDHDAIKGVDSAAFLKNVQVIEDLYTSLKSFEELYTEILSLPQSK